MSRFKPLLLLVLLSLLVACAGSSPNADTDEKESADSITDPSIIPPKEEAQAPEIGPEPDDESPVDPASFAGAFLKCNPETVYVGQGDKNEGGKCTLTWSVPGSPDKIIIERILPNPAEVHQSSQSDGEKLTGLLFEDHTFRLNVIKNGKLFKGPDIGVDDLKVSVIEVGETYPIKLTLSPNPVLLGAGNNYAMPTVTAIATADGFYKKICIKVGSIGQPGGGTKKMMSLLAVPLMPPTPPPEGLKCSSGDELKVVYQFKPEALEAGKKQTVVPVTYWGIGPDDKKMLQNTGFVVIKKLGPQVSIDAERSTQSDVFLNEATDAVEYKIEAKSLSELWLLTNQGSRLYGENLVKTPPDGRPGVKVLETADCQIKLGSTGSGDLNKLQAAGPGNCSTALADKLKSIVKGYNGTFYAFKFTGGGDGPGGQMLQGDLGLTVGQQGAQNTGLSNLGDAEFTAYQLATQHDVLAVVIGYAQQDDSVWDGEHIEIPRINWSDLTDSKLEEAFKLKDPIVDFKLYNVQGAEGNTTITARPGCNIGGSNSLQLEATEQRVFLKCQAIGNDLGWTVRAKSLTNQFEERTIRYKIIDPKVTVKVIDKNLDINNEEKEKIDFEVTIHGDDNHLVKKVIFMPYGDNSCRCNGSECDTNAMTGDIYSDDKTRIFTIEAYGADCWQFKLSTVRENGQEQLRMFTYKESDDLFETNENGVTAIKIPPPMEFSAEKAQMALPPCYGMPEGQNISQMFYKWKLSGRHIKEIKVDCDPSGNISSLSLSKKKHERLSDFEVEYQWTGDTDWSTEFECSITAHPYGEEAPYNRPTKTKSFDWKCGP